MSELLKIQVGSGGNLLEGWKNTDLPEIDVTKLPLPFETESASEMLAEHILEHCSTPDFFKFLEECKRILVPHGKLYISMPILDRLSSIHARSIIQDHGHMAAYTKDSLLKIMSVAGFSDVITLGDRLPIFGHYREIGEDKDNLESLRVLLIK